MDNENPSRTEVPDIQAAALDQRRDPACPSEDPPPVPPELDDAHGTSHTAGIDSAAPGQAVESARPQEMIAEPQPAPMFANVFVQPAPREIWRGLDLVIFLAVAIVWMVLSQLLSLAAYAVLKPIVGWQTTVMDLMQNAVFAVVAQVVYYGPLFLYIFILVSVQYKLPFWEGIRWRWPGGRQAAKIFLTGIVLAIGLLVVEIWLPQNKTSPLQKLFSSPAGAYAIAAFAVTVAPFMEELIFRGVLFAFFERMAGIRFALPATALLFTLIHVPEYWGAWSGLALILVVGFVCSTARAITKSVVPGVILHVAYNGTLMALLFIGSHHFRTLPGLYSYAVR